MHLYGIAALICMIITTLKIGLKIRVDGKCLMLPVGRAYYRVKMGLSAIHVSTYYVIGIRVVMCGRS